MATSRVISRLSKSALPKISPLKSSFQSQISSSVKRITQTSRLPVELSCLLSIMPLHSTTASARLRSLLPIQSQNWGLVPQGISMPL